MSEEYIYAVARVRSAELHLLTASALNALLAAKDYDECLRLLSDLGWNTEDTLSNILKNERDKTWKFVSELVKDIHVFDVFLYANDFHNLKAAIKSAADKELEGIYIDKDQCSVDPDLIKNAVAQREFSSLPSYMSKVAEEALDTLLRTGDGGLCDNIIDMAALSKIYEAGKSSNNEILKLYSELTVAAADIKMAIRSVLVGKDINTLKKSLAPCESLNADRLAKAAYEGLDAIYEYLSHTAYQDAIPEIKKSPSAFERWCDNLIISKIRPERHNPFSIGPLAAYILARENEIKTVRIILSGKVNNLPVDSLRERVREMYV